MNELELFAGTMSKSMTVRQVAEALNVDRTTITRIAQKLYPEHVTNGKTTFFDEQQVTAIKNEIGTGRNDLCNIAQVQNTTTEIEMRQKAAEVMAWLMRDNEQLKAKNAELKPKAAFFDQVADSRTALQMRDVAAALNIPGLGRNRLFAFLREQRVLDNRNIPYRQFQDSGYFRVIEQSYTDKVGEAHIRLKTLVYQRGVEYLRKMVERGISSLKNDGVAIPNIEKWKKAH